MNYIKVLIFGVAQFLTLIINVNKSFFIFWLQCFSSDSIHINIYIWCVCVCLCTFSSWSFASVRIQFVIYRFFYSTKLKFDTKKYMYIFHHIILLTYVLWLHHFSFYVISITFLDSIEFWKVNRDCRWFVNIDCFLLLWLLFFEFIFHFLL